MPGPFQMPPFDPYSVLGVPRDIDASSLKERIQMLTERFERQNVHPYEWVGQDRLFDDPESRPLIAAACRFLRHDSLRAQYDEAVETRRRQAKDYVSDSEYEEEDGELFSGMGVVAEAEAEAQDKPRLDVKFRSRSWAYGEMGKTLDNLMAANTIYDDVHERFARFMRVMQKPEKNVECLRSLYHALQYIDRQHYMLEEQMGGVEAGQWKNTPRIRSMLATLYRVSPRSEALRAKASTLEQTMVALEAAPTDQERRRLRIVFKIQATQ
ncbi:hypothetical protein F4818DRAFT_457007 [Hypoxylon cercidicola]|nr:hypothetical protein F4818DRAFT_457007 [Hypoxylon cercidicola]